MQRQDDASVPAFPVVLQRLRSTSCAALASTNNAVAINVLLVRDWLRWCILHDAATVLHVSISVRLQQRALHQRHAMHANLQN